MDPLTSGPAEDSHISWTSFWGAGHPDSLRQGNGAATLRSHGRIDVAVLARAQQKELGEIRWTGLSGQGRDLFVAPSPQEPDP